jgi:hypothetical protein
MQNEKLWREFTSLPPEGRRRVAKLIASLKASYHATPVGKTGYTDLSEERFIGMWKDRTDLEDSSTWVRRVRESEWRS